MYQYKDYLKECSYSNVLKEYEKHAYAVMKTNNYNATTSQNYTTVLTHLATVATYSVLKKLCNVSSLPQFYRLRQNLYNDTHNYERLQNALNSEYKYIEVESEDVDSDIVTIEKVVDQVQRNAIDRLLSYTYDDGMDLFQTAVEAILKETKKADISQVGFMTQPYTVRRLKKRVHIKEADSVNGYETVETTPIQEVYKAIRREVENSRAVRSANPNYTYLDDVIKDTETNTAETVYKRLSKHSQLAYEITDYNGKITALIASNQTADDLEKLIARMNLTPKQARVLDLRLRGYGQKAIATYLGITWQAVTKVLKQLQNSAGDIGLTL